MRSGRHVEQERDLLPKFGELSLLFGQLLVPLCNLPVQFGELAFLFNQLPVPFGKTVTGQGELLPKRSRLRVCFNAGAGPVVCPRITHAPWNHKSIPKGIPSSEK